MSAPSLNLPSFRLAFESQIASLPPEVQTVHRSTFNALTDIYQGFDALNSKVNKLKSTASAAAGATNITEISETIIEESGATIGVVNNQTGETSYTTQQSDYGAEIWLNDSSPIAVTLSVVSSVPGIQLPWFSLINNLGVATATLTPVSGLINGLASLPVPGGTFCIVYFDGTNFTAAVPGGTAAGGLDFSQIFMLMGG